jgi:hypothetical protein
MFIEMAMEKFFRHLMKVEALKVRRPSDQNTQKIESKALKGNQFHLINLEDAIAIK